MIYRPQKGPNKGPAPCFETLRLDSDSVRAVASFAFGVRFIDPPADLRTPEPGQLAATEQYGSEERTWVCGLARLDPV